MLVAPYQVPFAKEDIILIPLSTPKTGQFVKLLSKAYLLKRHVTENFNYNVKEMKKF